LTDWENSCVNSEEASLKEKTAKRISDALLEMFDATHMSVTEIFEVILGSQLPKKYRRLAQIGYKAGWVHIFKSRPEPNKAQLAEILAIIEGFKNAPRKMRNLLKQAVKNLPRDPGGPPRKIKPEMERTVCAEITGIRPECDTREAIRRVAAKHRVSERTIYRVWGKYNPKKKKKSPSPLKP